MFTDKPTQVFGRAELIWGRREFVPTLFDKTPGKAFIIVVGGYERPCLVLCDEGPGVPPEPPKMVLIRSGGWQTGSSETSEFSNGAPSGPQHSPVPGDHTIDLTGVEGFGKKFVTSPHTISTLCAGWSGKVLPSQNKFVDVGGDQVEHKPVQRRDV